MIAFWLSWPLWWPAVLLVPLGLVAAAWSAARRRRRATALFGEREAALLGVPCGGRERAVLAALSAAAVVVVLLQPVTLGAQQRPGADVVLCVDVSRSMLARDVNPSRFEAALAQIDALVAAAHGSRFSLLAFAGTAEVVAPLSADTDAIASLAHELVPGTRAGAGTRLDRAIELGREMLVRGGALGGVVVLLTDGEDFGADATAAAGAARAAGVRVDCLGFGSESGSKIVIEGGGAGSAGFLQDASGHDVVSRLDVEGLRAVAAAGGGQMLVAHAEGELVAWHESRWLPAAATAALRAGRVEPVPCHQWILCLAVLLWMLRGLLPERRR